MSLRRENSRAEEGAVSGESSPSLASSRKVSPLSSARTSPKPGKRAGRGKGGAGDKGRAEDRDAEEEQGKETGVKHRIFFIEKEVLSDDDLLAQLGREAWAASEPRSNMQGLMKAATFAKKFGREKKVAREERDSSIVYSGALRDRLSRDKQPEVDRSRVLAGSVKFLGKMMNRKDKHGLYGDMESTLATEDEADGGKEEKENPIIAALDKLNIKTHGRDSGVSRSMSSMSHAAADPAAGAAQEQGGDTAGGGGGVEVLGVLRGGLCRVTQETILSWNTNNNDRADV